MILYLHDKGGGCRTFKGVSVPVLSMLHAVYVLCGAEPAPQLRCAILALQLAVCWLLWLADRQCCAMLVVPLVTRDCKGCASDTMAKG